MIQRSIAALPFAARFVSLLRFAPLLPVPTSLLASLLAALLSPLQPSLRAQDNCPMVQAEHRAADLLLGPAQRCGGIDYQLGNITVSTMRDGCPLFSIYTPPHDVAVPSVRRTMVDSLVLQPITKVAFRCQQDWFLIIPIGSACVFDRQLNVGTVTLLLTRPCPERADA